MMITAADVIARLGGAPRIAAWCQIEPNSVQYWRLRGRIPLRYRDDLLRLAAEKGAPEITSEALIALAPNAGRPPLRREAGAA